MILPFCLDFNILCYLKGTLFLMFLLLCKNERPKFFSIPMRLSKKSDFHIFEQSASSKINYLRVQNLWFEVFRQSRHKSILFPPEKHNGAKVNHFINSPPSFSWTYRGLTRTSLKDVHVCHWIRVSDKRIR